MSQYLRLFPFLETGNAYIAQLNFTPNSLPILFSGKSFIDLPSPDAKLKNPKKPALDFLYALGGKLVVSEKVKLFLQELAESQYFEFIPVNFDQKKFPNYYVLNLLKVIDAFDWEKSDYKLFDELGPKGNKVINELRRMEIDESKTSGRELFGLLGYEGTTFISKTLAEKMQQANITGMQLIPLVGH